MRHDPELSDAIFVPQHVTITTHCVADDVQYIEVAWFQMIPRLPCLSCADKRISLSFQVSGAICNLALAYSATPKKWTPWLLERHPLTMAYQALACQVCPQWQGDTICLCLSQMLALCKDVSIMCRWVVEGPATCSVESRTGGPVNCYGNSALKGTKISQLVPSSWKSPYFKYL